MEPLVIDQIRDLQCVIKNNIGYISDRPKGIKNLSQYKILLFLNDHENETVYQKDICEALNLKKSSITEHLDYLELVGAIERIKDPTDKRKNSIKLSEQAINRKFELSEFYKNVDTKMKKGISEEDLQCFERIIKKMKENLND